MKVLLKEMLSYMASKPRRFMIMMHDLLLQSWGLPVCHTAAACPAGQPPPQGVASICSIEEGTKLVERTVLEAAAGRGTVADILQVFHLSAAAACSVISSLLVLALVKCQPDRLLSFAGSAAEASCPRCWKD